MPVYGPVGLLATHSSRELSEWIAFEQVYGPIGMKWDREVAAQMHELTQATNHLLGGLMADEKHPNQVPQPESLPRPWDEDDHTAPPEHWARIDDD
jgi:hypothetical protein